jgi:hypothetical protein
VIRPQDAAKIRSSRAGAGSHVPVGDVAPERRRRCEQLGLPLEPDHRLGVRDETRQQSFERELSLELDVLDFVDRAHPALAEQANDPVTSVDHTADQRIVALHRGR